jgi:hypothetical protein
MQNCDRQRPWLRHHRATTAEPSNSSDGRTGLEWCHKKGSGCLPSRFLSIFHGFGEWSSAAQAIFGASKIRQRTGTPETYKRVSRIPTGPEPGSDQNPRYAIRRKRERRTKARELLNNDGCAIIHSPVVVARGDGDMGKRREPRIQVRLQVRIAETDASGRALLQMVTTRDISRHGLA